MPTFDNATYIPEGEGGNAALLEARVFQVDPCVAVEDADGVTYVPVFPAGAVVPDGCEGAFWLVNQG